MLVQKSRPSCPRGLPRSTGSRRPRRTQTATDFSIDAAGPIGTTSLYSGLSNATVRCSRSKTRHEPRSHPAGKVTLGHGMRGSGLTRVAPRRWKLIDWIALNCADGATFCGTGPGWKESRCSRNRSARRCMYTRSMRWMTSSKLPGGPGRGLQALASLGAGLRQIRVRSNITQPLHRGGQWLIGEAGRETARRLRTQRGNLRRRVQGLRRPCRERRWEDDELKLGSRDGGAGRLWRIGPAVGRYCCLRGGRRFFFVFFVYLPFCPQCLRSLQSHDSFKTETFAAVAPVSP